MAENLTRFHGLTRPELMARIRSRGNKKTELAMMKLFREHRITGWRRHQPLPGRPDFAFKNERVALFVDGCFWHGCPLHYKAPTTRSEFWSNKVETNRARDKRVTRELRKANWTVVRIWECDLAVKRQKQTIARIQRALSRGDRRVRTLPE